MAAQPSTVIERNTTTPSGRPARDSPSRASPTAAMATSHTFWNPRYSESRLPNMRVSLSRPPGRRPSASAQRDERLQAILAQVETEPDEDPEQDLDDDRIAHAPVRADGPPDVSGQEDGAEHRGHRDQVDHDARELEDREGHDHRRRQSQM